MTITIQVLGEDTLLIQWPLRLTDELQEALWWILDGVDYVDHVERYHYTTHLRIASHLATVEEVATFVANALMDDTTLGPLFALEDWDDVSVSVEY